MHAHQVYSCVLAAVLVSSILAAPVKQTHEKEKRDATDNLPPSRKVEDQEAELENLVSLAGEKTKGNNIVVHESHVTHYENKDGHEIKAEKSEEKVTDTETGKVLADVKQVKETGSDENGEPQKVTETEVDIPDEGVHKTFVETDDEESDEQTDDDQQASVEFSPEAVAKYLMETSDFDNFYAALKDLVRSSVMSEEKAEQYEEEVLRAYQRMVAEQDAMAENYMNDEESYYPTYEEPEMKRSNMAPMDIQDNLYGLDRAYDNYLAGNLDLGRQGMMEDAPPMEEDSLSNIIDALLNAWWEKDFEGGNTRALALVSYLDDVVSRDDNPDDIGQIRDILADMLANALLNDVQNEETEYNMEQTENEVPSEITDSAITENTEEEETAEPQENSDEAEEELEEVAKVANTAEEKETSETDKSEVKPDDDVTSEEDKEKTGEEEKH